jgi:hypothetical protein
VIDNISLPVSSWFLPLALLVSLGFASLMYFREKIFDQSAPWVKKVMFILRFIVIFLIILLFLGPVVKSIDEERKDPIVVLLEDNSKSISFAAGDNWMTAFDTKISNLKNSLAEKYDVVHLKFGEFTRLAGDSIKDEVTNISEAIRFVGDNYGNQNLGHILLLSDGIYNEGRNPLYENFDFTAPISSVLLGDTSTRKDIVVKQVLHNKIAYLGDKFEIIADVAAYNCKNSNTTLKLEKIGSKGSTGISEKLVAIDSDNYFSSHSFLINADEAGINRYRVSLSSVSGEASGQNNYRDFYVEVIDGRQKILLYANAPHPDIAMLNTVIGASKNYDLQVKYPWDKEIALDKYDLVVFHNLPSQQNDIKNEIAILNKNKTPRIFIAGLQVSPARFNVVQDVLKINADGRNFEDVEPYLDGSFRRFTLSEGLTQFIGKMPPLQVYFGKFDLQGNASTLLKQKIKKIPTDYPMLCFGQSEGVNTTVFLGEGIWKWRMTDYLMHNSLDRITELINKTVQLTSIKEDKRKFRVELAKNLYKENENIVFTGQLYNDNYELVNEPEVSLKIISEDGREYPYNFSRTSNYYILDAGQFTEGNYRYQSELVFEGKQHKAEGRFSIEKIQLEQYDLRARHDMLISLAQKTNGQTYSENNMEEFVNGLKDQKNLKPTIYYSTMVKPIINLKWLFFILLILLGAEWFLRRYFGSY